MPMLIRTEEAADHLRIDHEYPDGYDELVLKIKAASKAIIRYLGDYAETCIEFDSDGEVEDADDDVKLACLLLTGEYFKNREGTQDGEIDQRYGYGYLPRPVVALLYPLRDPAVA